jgi:tungstate transport system ATP-binding protein
MSSLVTIQKLRIQREKTTVLEIELLEIRRGQVTALVGPNGAGKTTLLLALAGLLKPASGTILFEGQRLENIPAINYRRRIGLVMQDSLLLDRSVFENISLPLLFRSVTKSEINRRVDECLDRLNISALRSRRATQLSGGESQRVALARALVLQPDLLLLDEPFKSLDEASHAALLADLKVILPVTNCTTLFATHNAKDVHELADNKIALRNGRLCE